MDNIDNYPGSRLLENLSNHTSLNLDQLNFVVSQIVALGLAGLYRTILKPQNVSNNLRHGFGLFFGIWMAYFCFGYQALHLAVLPIICYLIIQTQNPAIIHGAVLFTAMFYLSLIHIYRQLFDRNSLGLDISGPLMVITEKVTSVAFNLHDGLVKNEDDMTETQKRYALVKMPKFLEFFSYTLLFPSLMAGPVIFFKDYIKFIEGSSTMMIVNNSNKKLNSSSAAAEICDEPSPRRAVYKKLTISFLCSLIFIILLPKFPISRLKSQDFIDETSFSYKFWYLIVATTLYRTKFYFAWTLADAICNNAGLGWNGQNWDHFSNIDIFKFEFGTNLKETIDSWNKGTNLWLRFIVYKRIEKYALFSTFILSAIWHGFFPGYYLTFLSGALFTFASRTIRRNVRPYFIYSNETKLIYDFITFTMTRFVIAYITFPFILLEFSGSIIIFNKLYWVLHLLAGLAIWTAPYFEPKVSDIGEKSQKNGIVKALSKSGPYTDAVGKID